MPDSPATVAGNGVLAGVTGEPGVAKPDPILVADGMRKTFGGVTAVDVDHLEVQRGVITALIGPNGAGKTTFFNVLTGFDDPDAGTHSFDGVKIDGKSPHELARRGMVRTFQLTKSLTKLSVIDNMKLGARNQRGESLWRSTLGWMWSSQEREIEEQADELLARFRLDHMREEYAGTLSGGQRKLLEMARALMSRPDLIMLDEPMAGVNPALTQSLLEHVKDLRAQGISVVFVEHDMDVVRDISDWVVVMAEGSIIAEGSHDAITSNSAVIDAYLGAHHDTDLDMVPDLDLPAAPPAAAEPGPPADPEPPAEPGTPGEPVPPDATDTAHDGPDGGPA
jgi:neutral amino acid transport system ATP-binding protein